MAETRIKLGSLGGWEEFNMPISLDEMFKRREICEREFKAYVEREKNNWDGGRLGFVQATFTVFWLDKNGIQLPQGFDRWPLVYSCYQKIKYMTEKGKWKTLPNLYVWPKEDKDAETW